MPCTLNHLQLVPLNNAKFVAGVALLRNGSSPLLVPKLNCENAMVIVQLAFTAKLSGQL